jgi:hypothetical protein
MILKRNNIAHIRPIARGIEYRGNIMAYRRPRDVVLANGIWKYEVVV